jgi:hypothetical protein
MELERCYRILGIRSDAELTEIKTAFRRLAREYHPDRNKAPGAEEKFNEITEAYGTILSSHGVPVGTLVDKRSDSKEEDFGGKLSFTIFTDKQVVYSVSPKLFEREVQKRFNPNLPAGSSCKIGKTWFEIDIDSSKKLPILGSRLGQRKILIEWYKDADGNDKSRSTTWEKFWTYVRRCASLAEL